MEITDNTTVEIIVIDPEAAAEMLERNYRNNRSINPNRVRAYAADMTAGKWTFTGESLKFMDDGKLIDGQHRLSAIVASGCSVQMMVVQGVEPNAVTNIDTGPGRSLKNVLEFLSYENSTGLATTLSASFVYEHYMEDKIVRLSTSKAEGIASRKDDGRRPYQRYSNSYFSRYAALDRLDRRPTLQDSVATMKPHSHARQTQIIRPSIGAVSLMHNIATAVDDGASVIEYVEQVRSAEGHVEDPTWQVAQILIRDQQNQRRGDRMQSFTRDSLWFRGYDYYMSGQRGKLRTPKLQSYPTIPGDVEWYAAGQ